MSMMQDILQNKQIALLFPGQGTHNPKMLEGVSALPYFKERYEIVCDLLKANLLQEIEHSENYINLNKVSSLITVLTSTLSLDIWRDSKQSDVTIKAYAGYSVGQWTALYAAGAISAADLFRIIYIRAQKMDECIAKCSSGMIAIIGVDKTAIEKICTDIRNSGHYIIISNYNAVGQYTIAGEEVAINLAEKAIMMLSPKKCQRVPVAGAWHTNLLEPAQKTFRTFLQNIQLNIPKNSVLDNITGSWLPMIKKI